MSVVRGRVRSYVLLRYGSETLVLIADPTHDVLKDLVSLFQCKYVGKQIYLFKGGASHSLRSRSIMAVPTRLLSFLVALVLAPGGKKQNLYA